MEKQTRCCVTLWRFWFGKTMLTLMAKMSFDFCVIERFSHNKLINNAQ